MPESAASQPAAPVVRLAAVAGLLSLSGACAPVYQVAWVRELRLIFGGATPAAAAADPTGFRAAVPAAGGGEAGDGGGPGG